MKVLYPGSFDPPHNGHVQLVETAARLFGPVVVAAARNSQKAPPLFDLEERVAMLRESLAHVDGVEVTTIATMAVTRALEVGADCIVKGLRGGADLDFELPMAHMNHAVSGVRTVFLPAAPAHSFLASRLVREVASLGGDVSALVPAPVLQRLTERFPR